MLQFLSRDFEPYPSQVAERCRVEMFADSVFTVSADTAFQMLVRASQDTNVRLVDVARLLTEGKLSRAKHGDAAPGAPNET